MKTGIYTFLLIFLGFGSYAFGVDKPEIVLVKEYNVGKQQDELGFYAGGGPVHGISAGKVLFSYNGDLIINDPVNRSLKLFDSNGNFREIIAKDYEWADYFADIIGGNILCIFNDRGFVYSFQGELIAEIALGKNSCTYGYDGFVYKGYFFLYNEGRISIWDSFGYMLDDAGKNALLDKWYATNTLFTDSNPEIEQFIRNKNIVMINDRVYIPPYVSRNEVFYYLNAETYTAFLEMDQINKRSTLKWTDGNPGLGGDIIGQDAKGNIYYYTIISVKKTGTENSGLVVTIVVLDRQYSIVDVVSFEDKGRNAFFNVSPQGNIFSDLKYSEDLYSSDTYKEGWDEQSDGYSDWWEKHENRKYSLYMIRNTWDP